MAKRFKLKMQEAPEKVIQDAILRFIKLDRRIAWAKRMNTGAHVVDVPNQARRFIRYGFKGCSDILGQAADGRFVAIEVKKRTGKATQEQKDFLNLVNRSGGIAILARSIDDVQEALNKEFQ